MRLKLITFSGVEGAGKSTQSRFVCDYLQKHGVKCRHVEFIQLGLSTMVRNVWRPVRGTPIRIRKMSTNHTSAAEEGPAVRKSAKRVSGQDWMRVAVYAVDAVLFRSFIFWNELLGVKAVVCDRYFFDSLVRLSNIDHLPVRLLRRLIPIPALPFVLNVSSTNAVGRRPGASPEYMRLKRDAFGRLARFYPQWVLVDSNYVGQTQRVIAEHVANAFSEIR